MTVCIEKKIALSGNISFFECELLYLGKDLGILKYVIDRRYTVNSVKLDSGDITYALYWTDKPYTLYIWHPQGGRVNYYFNVADSVSLSHKEFVWRDLVVDVLVDADRNVHVLDEDELPENISPELRSFIEDTKRMILQNYRKMLLEADKILDPVLAAGNSRRLPGQFPS